MTRFYALVLIRGDVPEDEACDAAFGLLSPYMLSDAGRMEDARFDYLLDPEDIAALSEGEAPRNVWPAGDIVDQFGELQVEAIISPDGRWHELDYESGQLWDDDAWLSRAREILHRCPECLALRHVLHI